MARIVDHPRLANGYEATIVLPGSKTSPWRSGKTCRLERVITCRTTDKIGPLATLRTGPPGPLCATPTPFTFTICIRRVHSVRAEPGRHTLRQTPARAGRGQSAGLADRMEISRLAVSAPVRELAGRSWRCRRARISRPKTSDPKIWLASRPSSGPGARAGDQYSRRRATCAEVMIISRTHAGIASNARSHKAPVAQREPCPCPISSRRGVSYRRA
jgi:hypothetical protein